MGLFDSRTELQKYIAKINETTGLRLGEEEITKYTEIISETELIKLLYKIVKIEDSYTSDFLEHLTNLMEIRKTIVNERNRADLESTYTTLVDLYFENRSLLENSKVVQMVSNAFDDKTMVAETFRFLNNNENILDGTDSENLNILISYLEEARQYFVDDRALFSSFISLVNDLDPAKLKYGKEKQLKTAITKKIKEDKKASGIYDIDQATLLEMARKIEALDLSAQRLETLIQSAEQERASLQDASKNHLNDLTELRIKELKALKDEANAIIKNFNAAYAELLSKEKESIKNERDILVGELDREIDARRTQLLGIADNVGQRIGIELRRIRNVSDDSIQRIETFLSSNDDIKKLLSEAKSSDEFLTLLKSVEKMAQSQSPSSPIIMPQQGIAVPQTGSVLDGLYMPSIIIPEERQINPNPIYFFDESIPFKDRYQQLMDIKNQMIEKGAIFHEKFDEILTMVLLGDAPYMYGSSGCGKTYMIQKQLAKILGIDVVINGYVLYEQDILGYTNSGTGAYVPSNFYRCYKFGDIIFFDELDNGIANATTVLNSFLTGSSDDTYVFPNGEHVKRNPNFRIMAAGNTKGTGKTLAHNTRQKMDESVMQRLTPVEIGYDNRIEEQILSDYPGWFDFAINFRKAIESIPSEHGGDTNTIGTFTTRDAQSVKKYKDAGAMTDEQLIDYEIIENKDIDYLNQIKKKLIQYERNGDFSTEEGRTLLKTFQTKVEGRTK